MYTKGGLLVEIKERKLRKVGNSVVMTLSKEFLESIGATATDTVYVDEEKLKDIIVKNMSEHQKITTNDGELKTKHNELYKELVTK